MADPRGDEPTVAGTPAGVEPAELTLSGRIAGRWEIVALVGTGGMGNVYRAIDHELGETVALKVLRRAAADPLALERFRGEVKLARRVTHGNVARTHDIGSHDGSMFLTMELVEGDPLTDRLARRAIGWRDAAAIARSICSGVGAAHLAGVVHRDLKPDNVMIARDGRVVVTDFGIAATHEVATGGLAVEVTGTPVWMAPEQLAGLADARSDVYAIGEILWTMLYGAHPWLIDGTLQVMARAGQDPPTPPRGDVPDSLAAVVARCLAREPSARYPDAVALGDALTAAIGAAALPAERTVPPPTRHEVRVGVEPIRNLGDPEHDFVAAGLVEDLIDVLGRSRGVRVRPVASGGDRGDLDVVVGGSLRRAGDQVRISVRVTGARDGFQVWGERFDRRLDDILRVSDEIARDVATALSITAASVGPGREVATDREAVELYLRARQLSESSWIGDPRPLAMYQAALQRVPGSPVMLAAYATLLSRRINSGTADPEVIAAEAEDAARRAIAHGPSLPEPWAALAVVHFNRSREVEAIRAARIALDRGPGSPEAAEAAGRMLTELDPGLDEGIALLERARWANPRAPTMLLDLLRAHGLRGNWDRVDEILRDPVAASPALLMARARFALWHRMPAPTFPVDLPSLAPVRWMLDLFVDVSQTAGVSDEAQATFDQRLRGIAPRSRVRRLFGQLGVEMMLSVGKPDQIWPFLDDALDNGLLDLAWLDRLPMFEPVRGDPRLVAARALVAERGAPALAAWRGPMPSADDRA